MLAGSWMLRSARPPSRARRPVTPPVCRAWRGTEPDEEALGGQGQRRVTDWMGRRRVGVWAFQSDGLRSARDVLGTMTFF
jgi:hypothetical protein